MTIPWRRTEMILATTKGEDFDRFLKIFSTKGAEKRKQHGSKGSHVFRDPNEDDRVWVLFDWDAEGWQSFVSDPEVPPILQEAGHQGKPQAAELGGRYDASRLLPNRRSREEIAMEESPIKVGVIAEQTGALSFMGIADANVAKMVV